MLSQLTQLHISLIECTDPAPTHTTLPISTAISTPIERVLRTIQQLRLRLLILVSHLVVEFLQPFQALNHLTVLGCGFPGVHLLGCPRLVKQTEVLLV